MDRFVLTSALRVVEISLLTNRRGGRDRKGKELGFFPSSAGAISNEATKEFRGSIVVPSTPPRKVSNRPPRVRPRGRFDEGQRVYEVTAR